MEDEKYSSGSFDGNYSEPEEVLSLRPYVYILFIIRNLHKIYIFLEEFNNFSHNKRNIS